MFKWKGILLASALMTVTAFAKDAMLVRFDLTDSIKQFLRANEFDITGINYKTNEIEALLTEAELDLIKSQKTTIRYSFPQSLAMAPDQRYQNPDKIEDFVKETHARFPDITQLKIIGKSLEGRDIYAIKISDNAQLKEAEPSILVNAMHHAREVMTPEITTDMVEYLTTNYGQIAEVTNWVNNTEIWVIPMLNLDGNNKMWMEDSMWRKNTRNGHGVDINRNYPANWNSCKGSSDNTGDQDYRGEAPASEPETQAMMNLVQEIKPVFDISFHSYSELVIYPFGCRPLKTPTGEAITDIGAEIGKKLDYKVGTAWELLYNADGGDIDWMYTAHQVIPYVIEVNSTMVGFHPNYNRWRNKTVVLNRKAWMHLLDRLNGASVQGMISNNTYKTVKIFKVGETTAVQEYKINPDGSYYIIMKPGKYDFSFEGTQTKKFLNVTVNDKQSFSF